MPIVDPPFKRQTEPPPGYTFSYSQPVRPAQPKATYTLLGLMAGTYILELVVAGLSQEWFELVFPISYGWWLHPWQLVTSTFSHASLTHLFFNGLFFYFFGPNIEGIIGRRRFVVLFLVTGAISGVVQVHLPAILTNLSGYDFGSSAGALGASGALMGVFGVSLILLPNSKMIVFPIFVPVPLWVGGIFFVLLDLVGALNPNSGVGNFAHLAGLALGILYGLQVKEGLRRRGLKIVHG